MRVWKITDVGMARKDSKNEDILRVEMIDDNHLLAVVCDGMGGANAGEVASEIAINTFWKVYSESYAESGDAFSESNMLRAIERANDDVFMSALENAGMKGMGTTLVAVLCDEHNALLANVGDSRAYLINEDGINNITVDHSVVSEMVKRGEITRMEAQRHPSRNLITRALGVEPEVKGDTYRTAVKEGDFILLCSDGLNDQVSEPEIYYEVYESGEPQNACANLVKVANDRGGTDNITIILIAF